MNRRIGHVSVLALAVALAGAAFATPTDSAPVRAKADRSALDRNTLDKNHDGAIDRAEAVAHLRLAEKFDRLDRNGDGKLEKAEHRRHKHHGRRGGMARAIRLDTDGDGRISTIEAGPSRWGERFTSIDRSGDGYLVRSELDAAAEQRRSELTAKRAQRFEAKFTEADGNRDGRLSRAEVEANWPHRARAFAFLDEDRDGYLGRADLAPRRR